MTTVVTGTIGRETGTGPARRIREEGNLPGVVYGLGVDPVAVTVSYAELREALKGPAGLNTVFQLEIDGSQTRVLVKELQRDAIKRTVTHADFLRVDDSVPVKVTLPVHLVGRASKILDSGGIVEQKMFQMKVQCVPTKIPVSIEVDVTKLKPTSRLSVGDITLPDGVVPLMSSRITVAAPVVSRAARIAALEEDDDESTDETSVESADDSDE